MPNARIVLTIKKPEGWDELQAALSGISSDQDRLQHLPLSKRVAFGIGMGIYRQEMAKQRRQRPWQ